MMNWKYWLFLVVMTGLMVAFVLCGSGDPGHGNVPWAAMLCFLALVLMFIFGLVYTGGHRPNKALYYALLAYFGAASGFHEWFYARSLVGLVGWTAFALIGAYISWQNWKVQKLHRESDKEGRVG